MRRVMTAMLVAVALGAGPAVAEAPAAPEPPQVVVADDAPPGGSAPAAKGAAVGILAGLAILAFVLSTASTE